MRLVRVAIHRLRSLFRKDRAETEMRRELEIHVEQLIKANLARGMSEPDARLAARQAFGSIESTKEQCRDMRRVSVVEDAMRDVSHACRLMLKSPGFALTTIVSLALGIGANAALFALVQAVLLRSMPVPHPEQLVEIARVGRGRTLSYPMYELLRDRGGDVFSGLFVTSSGRFGSSSRLGTSDVGDVQYTPVSNDFLSTLNLSPIIGRDFSPAVDAVPEVIVSFDFWQRAAGGDPNILGKALTVARRPYTIVGVTPPGFTGVMLGRRIDVWVPIVLIRPQQQLRNPDNLSFRVMARLKPGVPLDRGAAAVDAIAKQGSQEWHWGRPLVTEVNPGGGGITDLRRRFGQPLVAMMFVAALLLTMAATNVANLLLARASARQREMGIRLSLGAGRGRLIRQLMTESLVLGALGGALGLAIAPAAATFLVRFLSSAVGELQLTFQIDPAMIAVTIAASMAVVIIFGLAPALAATRIDLVSMFKGGAASSGSRAAQPGRLLLVAQVAISCVLLTGALLFWRNLSSLVNLDAGFHRQNVLLLQLGTEAGGPAGAERMRLFERLMARLGRAPGVEAVALSSENLFSGNTWTEPILAPGFTPAPRQEIESVLLVVSPGFFRTLGTPLLRGRDFAAQDDERGARVAIVNEAVVRFYFANRDVVGQTLSIGGGPPLTIVGVVRDVKYNSLKDPAPRIVYLPYLQNANVVADAQLAIRTSADPDSQINALEKEVKAESSILRVTNVTTQSRLVLGTIAQDRLLAQLSGFFGLTGGLLISIGLYGLTAYQVARRTPEIGVRMALGARPAHVLGHVIRGALALVAIGVVLGLAAAAGLVRLVETLLFGVSGTDPVTFAAAAAILVAVGLLAAYPPARRASRVDPTTSLKWT